MSALLHALQDADDEGYVRVCEALAGFDVRDRLGEIGAPVLAVAGADDPVTTTEHLRGDRRRRTPRRARRARRRRAPGAGRAPDEVAALIRRHVLGEERPMTPVRPGMAVRREVLGDEHVDRAIAEHHRPHP